jgi:hypothetical protein
MLLLSIAKWRNLLNSQSLVYDGDRQAPPDLLNLLPEGTDLDPGIWLTRHKSIPAFPRRKPAYPETLGWEFQFLVSISGTPIVRILILFLIPKIPVGLFF